MACCLAASKLALLAPLLQFHSTFDSSCCQVLKITPVMVYALEMNVIFTSEWHERSRINLLFHWLFSGINNWKYQAGFQQHRGTTFREKNKWLRLCDETIVRLALRWLQGIWDLFLVIINGHIINALVSRINHFTSFLDTVHKYSLLLNTLFENIVLFERML